MTVRSPWAIYVAILVMVVAVSVFVYYHSGRLVDSEWADTGPLPDTEQPDEAAEAAPGGVRIEGGEVEQMDEHGKLLWRVRASGELVYDESVEQLQGSGIEFEVYTEERPTVKLQAARFLVDRAGKRIEFADGVTGTTEDGDSHFEVREMEYQASTEKLVGSGGVTLRWGEYQATADQVVIDVKNRQTRMRGNVLLARRR